MHNDLMRGAGVFAQAADSVFDDCRRSDQDENKRVFKATKLRHSSDTTGVHTFSASTSRASFSRILGKINEDDHVKAVASNQSGDAA